jgi:pimeloyl-ACP methyl ester carboxylesterase
MGIRAANFFSIAVTLWIGQVRAAQTAAHDPAAHTVERIAVDEKVQLEVLDWGGPHGAGTGRALVLLAGLGNTAHIFDEFAPKLTGAYHVYGITRRGYGASSAPEFGYSADRLGDDVLAVIDALKLDRPVLVGNGLAGEELSSVGSRHPEKVAGLIYLDAAYSYAYYEHALGDLFPPDLFFDVLDLEKKLDQAHLLLTAASSPGYKKDLAELRKELEQIQASDALAGDARLVPLLRRLRESGLVTALAKDLREEQQVNPTLAGSKPEPVKRREERKKLFEDLLQTILPAFEKELRETKGTMHARTASSVDVPEPELRWQPAAKSRALAEADRANHAILQGRQKYTHLRVPVLAIYSIPQGDGDDGADAAQAKAFEAGVPGAKVIRLPGASSFVFLSNEADVLREMNAFLGALK